MAVNIVASSIPEPTETSALLAEPSSSGSRDDTLAPPKNTQVPQSVYMILSVLLIGVFLSQADTMLILANYPLIASELSDLSAGSWLLTAYMLAQCAAQPLYGKLSDIFGRKTCLQAAYLLFAAGSLASGLGRTLGAVVGGRAVQGLGGAGMVCLVSILITELVPMSEVAQLRSYVNIVQTLGRASGAPLGGLLAERVGWRWSFLGQVPIALLAMGLVQWKLPLLESESSSSSSRGVFAKLRRIDFPGAFFLSATILCICLILDAGGSRIPWDSPLLFGLVGGALVAALGFLITARYYATEPIFPIELMSHYVVVTNYALLFLQNLLATAVLFMSPLYFQVLAQATPAKAGLYLIPSIVGNTVGGLATGYWIKRTGQYKPPIAISPWWALLSVTLMLALWKSNGQWPLSLLLFPLGLATGAVHSATFVALASGVTEDEIAIAGSGMYLSGGVGGLVGISASNAIFQGSLRAGLTRVLEGWDDKEMIMQKLLADMTYIQHASRHLRVTLMPAYVEAFQHVLFLALAAALGSIVVACIIRGKTLFKI
ncbi:hypothetical protein E8E14_000763 [Neopestalotiopsis sp. 37M]|nr:hypothetical protein E8E14_000763 [Neopestalotiopsis sp. 37M]